VLVYMLDHALTGSIVFHEPSGIEHTVYFLGGVPAKARLGVEAALLGQELIAMGVLDARKLEVALAGAKRLDLLLGEYLVGHNQVTRDVLGRALEQQLVSKISSLANLAPETEYGYYRDLNMLDAWGGEDLMLNGPLTPILASVRVWHDRARIRATLARVGKHPLTLHDEADLAALALTKPEEDVISTIVTKQVSLPALFQMRVADEDTVCSLVYTLAVTRQFGFKGQKKGPMAPKGTTPTPVRPEPAQVALRPATAHSSASQAMPGAGSRGPGSAPQNKNMQVLRPITGSGVRAASMKSAQSGQSPLASTLSPFGSAQALSSRSPAAGVAVARTESLGTSGAVNPLATTMNAQMEAQPEESIPPISPRPKPTMSVDVDFGRDDGGAVAQNANPQVADAERALEAMTNFRLAETALQRGDLSLAERLSAKAFEGDPEQSEYRVLNAWVRAMGNNPRGIEQAIEVMTEVLRAEPNAERALLYRGKLYKRANRPKEALKDFEALLKVNPKHREGASEVRLLKMHAK
jgi:hypothetical protein